jgi:hypothetical protein
LCAAFFAQQQGITLGTALKKVPEPLSDTWLIVAEFARQAAMADIDEQFGARSQGDTGNSLVC